MSSKPPRLCPVNCRSPNKTPGVTRLPLCWLWVSAGSCPSGRPSQLPSPGPVSARVSPYWGSSHVNMSDISCQYVRHLMSICQTYRRSRDTEEVPLQLEGSDVSEAAQLRRDWLYPVILNIKNCQLCQLWQLVYFQSGDLHRREGFNIFHHLDSEWLVTLLSEMRIVSSLAQL